MTSFLDLARARRGHFQMESGLHSGLWFDLARSYGVYVFVGETATVARWMRFELEGGIGVQGRYR